MKSGMDAAEWTRIEALFFEGLDLSAEERAAWLRDMSVAEPQVAREVGDMLGAHLSGPPLRIEAELDRETEVEGRSWQPMLPPGTRVGPYRVEGLLGSGGMAEVYRAQRMDGLYRQAVALKVVRPGYHAAEFIRLFESERRILARLQHRDIAAILGGGTTEKGLPYLAMQLVEGLPITRYCLEGAVPLRERLRLFVRVCEAVQFAHASLIVHRDLKASNILVTPSGDPVLLDFGIAKLLSPDPEDPASPPTRAGVYVLTPEHAAPEQLTGGPVTTATDVFALGLLLFELLTDRKPTGTKTSSLRDRGHSATLDDARDAPSRSVDDRALARKLSGDLDRIVGKALREDAGRRYASAGQLADDVERYLAGLPVRAQPDSVRYRAEKFVRRHARLLIAAAVVALMLVGSTAVSLAQARRVSAERDRAERLHEQSEAVVGVLTSLFESSNPRLVPGADTLRISAFLEQAESEVEQLGSEPALQARMWQVLGRMHMARSRYDRAIPLLERSYALSVESAGRDDTESARAEHQLARAILAFHGQEAATPLLRASSDRLARLLGEAHPDALDALQVLAAATEDADERSRLMDRVTGIHRRSPGGDSVATASLFNAQATEHLHRGQLSEALALFEHAGLILDKTLGPEHPNRLTVAGNTVTVLMALALYDRAETLARSVLEARERVLGAESQEVAIAKENLALIRANQGAQGEAEMLLRESLGVTRNLLAPGHELIRNTLRNLGLVVAQRGDPRAGLLLLDSALAGAPAATGVFVEVQRGLLLLQLGQFEMAGRAIDAGAEAVSLEAPEGHVYHAHVAVAKGLVSLSLGRPGAAEVEFGAALTLLEPLLANDHPLVSQAECGLAVSRTIDLPAPAEPDPSCTAYARWGLANPTLLSRAGLR